MTEPPPRANFSASANQMEIFDSYVEELAKQVCVMCALLIRISICTYVRTCVANLLYMYAYVCIQQKEKEKKGTKSSAKDEEKPLGKKSLGDLQGVSVGDSPLWVVYSHIRIGRGFRLRCFPTTVIHPCTCRHVREWSVQ